MTKTKKERIAWAIRTRDPEPNDFRVFVTTMEAVEAMTKANVCKFDVDDDCFYRTKDWDKVMASYKTWEKKSRFWESVKERIEENKLSKM